MQKKSNFFPVFFIFLILAVVILVLSLLGKVSHVSSFLEKGTAFLPKLTYGFFQGLPFVSEGERIKRLKSENLELVAKLVEQEKLRKENAALLSQFQTSEPRAYDLLPSAIVGSRGFIPGVTTPSSLILDRGEKDFVAAGDSVVLKNNLIGKVSQVSSYLAKVDLVTNTSVAFPAKTVKGALGVVKGGGGDKMTLDNILPSENIKVGDLVLTKGNVNMDGMGIPPDLIVGKIQSIEKIPTALFQRAEVKSLIDFTKLSTVFIIRAGK